MNTTIEQPQVTLNGLDICTSYWLTITSISYCGHTSSTEPTFIGIKDAVQYELALALDNILCSEWITKDTQEKIMDMETALAAAGPSCGDNGLTIPCFLESQWQCSEDDDTKVTFK